jgi:hypothetical protein
MLARFTRKPDGEIPGGLKLDLASQVVFDEAVVPILEAGTLAAPPDEPQPNGLGRDDSDHRGGEHRSCARA